MPDAPALLTRFQNVRSSGDGWSARCPAHEDGHNSLSIRVKDDGTVLLKCHANCSQKKVITAAQLTRDELFPNTGRQRKSRIVAEYDYCDEHGDILYQVLRLEPKDFRQRKPNGTGWSWKLGKVRRVVFGLPELVGHKTVCIVEGEKDVLSLRKVGLAATTNAGGAGKWRLEFTAQLKAAGVEGVLIVPDRDEPGRQHAATVAASCASAGLRVKVLELPGLPDKGDVSDYLAAGHGREDIAALVRATPYFEPEQSSTNANQVSREERASTSREAQPVKSIDLASVLDRVKRFVRRFVVLTDEQASLNSLWVAHTHVLGAFDCTPYIQVTSATARAGKTRLLETCELLVAHPWLTGRTSAAALVRKVDADEPTLLLDESDAAFGGEREYAEALRGILNTGYRRSGRTTLCVGQGANLNFRDFSTFSAKMIAGIGELPSTVADRAILIELKRRKKTETVERFRERDARIQAQPIRDDLAVWAKSAVDALRSARPALPSELNDRAQDVVEPLLAIADLASQGWPERARRAAIALMGEETDEDIAVELLHDIRGIFEEELATFIPSKELAEQLGNLDDRPWATWSKGKPITGHRLARMLKRFGIIPDKNPDRTARGYYRDRFNDSWSRYPVSKCPKRPEGNKTRPGPSIFKVSEDPLADTSENRRNANNDSREDALDTFEPGWENPDGHEGDRVSTVPEGACPWCRRDSCEDNPQTCCTATIERVFPGATVLLGDQDR